MTTLIHHLGEATQRELDFVDWLAELSAGVEWKYLRWFEDDGGGVGDDQFCADCAELERRVRKHKGKKAEPYRHLNGWDDAGEEDSQPFCARCGALLHCSPTRYCLEQDIEWLEDATEMDATNAAAIHNWLTGMGDYQREEDWPAIEPHAVRLMLAAGREVIDDGLVRFRPSDVRGSRWYAFDSIWLSIYEYFAGKLKEWANGRGVFHFINQTSGIGDHGCAPIGCTKTPHARLRELFEHVGRGTDRQAFLDWLGLKTIGDLDTPIVIPDDRCGWPTFDVRGRRLKRPGPNKSHPEALVVTHADLRLHTWDQRPRWSYNLFYDFNHWDRSSWCVSIEQADGQRLPEFMAAIQLWMEDILEPPARDDRFRSHRLREWDQIRAALGRVFYFSELEDSTAAEVGLTDALAGIEGGSLSAGRIRLDQVRFVKLAEWVEQDVQRRAAREATRGN